MSVFQSGLLNRRAKAPSVRLAPSPPTDEWPSGKAPACNTGIPGSIPGSSSARPRCSRLHAGLPSQKGEFKSRWAL